MALVIDTDPIPLKMDQDGTVRIGGTRVTLDTIVTAYQQGSTPEEIAEQFPAVALPDVYATIGFYLRRRPDVEAYLSERRRQAEAIRQENERRFPSGGTGERLSSRRAQRKP